PELIETGERLFPFISDPFHNAYELVRIVLFEGIQASTVEQLSQISSTDD
ncbi:MAG: hypothetical protein HZA16_12460, partial [Nitrospirae bacterium]|nr:hypothetical protein [Nitrospirota bacterium]